MPASPPRSVLISRTDAIGDVVLTLPMARALKDAFPGVRVGFLAKPYTHPVLEACPDVDEVLSVERIRSQQRGAVELMAGGKWEKWDAIIHVSPNASIASYAKRRNIPMRIGTTNRLFHWWTCNRLVRLGRKNSDLHEAQLNMRLLEPFGLRYEYSLEQLEKMVQLTPTAVLPEAAEQFLSTPRPKVIIHATSRGSAREWPLKDFARLAELLHDGGHVVALTGVETDSLLLLPLLKATAGVAVDFVGRLSLAQMLSFIQRCDGLVAASTGPLHLAGVLGIATVGLYPPERPMHAGRWAPLGSFAETITASPGGVGGKQNILEGISAEDVYAAMQRQLKLREKTAGR